jgi:hypothetical protein
MQRSGSDEKITGDACLAPVLDQQTGEGRDTSTKDSSFMQQERLSAYWHKMHQHLKDGR